MIETEPIFVVYVDISYTTNAPLIILDRFKNKRILSEPIVISL
jgi:hypothetical protein